MLFWLLLKIRTLGSPDCLILFYIFLVLDILRTCCLEFIDWMKITAIVPLNNTIKSICWSTKGRSQNMPLSRPWESWETSGSASAEIFWQKVTKPDPKNWRKPRKHFVVSYSASGIRFSGSQQSPCQSITNLIPVVFYFEEPQAFLMDIICSINNGEVLGQVI